MSTSSTTLSCFAYGEDLEGLPPRSLGYRLLTPVKPEPWSAEVEALARRLQGAPYPDHWPPTDLFCSVLLADGRRLVALARYGLADHTPSQRRGGLELIGALTPASLAIPEALAIYRWFQERRGQTDDLHTLGGEVELTDVLAQAASWPPPPSDPVPILPIRLWQEGALLFAATAPSDPDHRLGLLEQGAGGTWQWLPLVGADFPLQSYAQRGPLVAWTPYLTGVALKLDRKPMDDAPARKDKPHVLLGGFGWLLLASLLILGGANLWAILSLQQRLETTSPPGATSGSLPREPAATEQRSPPGSSTAPLAEDACDRFSVALYDAIRARGGNSDWLKTQGQLLALYEQMVRENKDLRVRDSNTKGKLAVGAVGILSLRSIDRLEEMIKRALSNRGYDPNLVKAACERVRQQIAEETRESP